MCDMLDSGHIRGKIQDYVDLRVPCNGAPRLRAGLGMHACQPPWPWICERLDAIVPSTEVALFHMSEVSSVADEDEECEVVRGMPDQVRSVASPVADEDGEWEVVRSVASPVGDEDEESFGLVHPRRAL